MQTTVRIAAGIVTYNPEINRLRKNIEAILPQVECIIIADNGSLNFAEIENLSMDKDGIILLANQSNRGIATALNQIFEKSIELGYGFTLTLDQDSISPDDLVFELTKDLDESIAIMCPFINDINRNDIIKPKECYTEVKRCITSGSLTRNRAWQAINGFDEVMFIDGVDFDFCDRLIKKEYRIVQTNSVELIHEIGKIKMRHLFGIKVIVRNHSAFRKYYITRNIVYLDRKNQTNGYPIKTLCRVLKQLVLVSIYENDKKQKIKRMLEGTLDGFKIPINKGSI